jgi:hypothetical protein
MYEVLKIFDSTPAAARQNGVIQWCALQTPCCDRIPCCRQKSMGNIHNLTPMFREVLQLTEGPMVAGRKEWRPPKLEKLVALECCKVLMPSFGRIGASQPDKWLSVFQPAKQVLVASSVISDIRRCARDGFLGSSQSNTKPRESNLFRIVGMLWGKGRGLLILDC